MTPIGARTVGNRLVTMADTYPNVPLSLVFNIGS